MRKFLLALVATLTIAAPLAVAVAPAEAATMSQRQAVGAPRTTSGYSRSPGWPHRPAVVAVRRGLQQGRRCLRGQPHQGELVQPGPQVREVLPAVSHFSRAGLIQQLESPYGEKFTHGQAVYGVNHVGL